MSNTMLYCFVYTGTNYFICNEKSLVIMSSTIIVSKVTASFLIGGFISRIIGLCSSSLGIWLVFKSLNQHKLSSSRNHFKASFSKGFHVIPYDEIEWDLYSVALYCKSCMCFSGLQRRVRTW